MNIRTCSTEGAFLMSSTSPYQHINSAGPCSLPTLLGLAPDTQDIKPATSRLPGPLRPHSKRMNGSYIRTSPIHWDNGPTEAYELYLYFHILGVSFLLCPLLYSVSQTVILAYNRLRLRSREFDSSIGDSTFDRGPVAEAQGR